MLFRSRIILPRDWGPEHGLGRGPDPYENMSGSHSDHTSSPPGHADLSRSPSCTSLVSLYACFNLCRYVSVSHRVFFQFNMGRLRGDTGACRLLMCLSMRRHEMECPPLQCRPLALLLGGFPHLTPNDNTHTQTHAQTHTAITHSHTHSLTNRHAHTKTRTGTHTHRRVYTTVELEDKVFSSQERFKDCCGEVR